MGITVYGMMMSPNVVRVISLLNEKGLEYELSIVDLSTGAHKQPDYLAINPFGRIPAIKDGEDVVFDSRAINRYIATKYKTSGPDLLPAGCAAVETWLEVEPQQFSLPATGLAFEFLIKPMLGQQTDEAVVEAQAAKLSQVLDVYEARLAQSKYLGGSEFSLADLNIMIGIYVLSKSPKADLVTSRPHISAWWAEVSSREAWKKAAASIPF